jgi:hypothetical protein
MSQPTSTPAAAAGQVTSSDAPGTAGGSNGSSQQPGANRGKRILKGWLAFFAILAYLIVLSYVAAAFPERDAPKVFAGGGILLAAALFVVSKDTRNKPLVLLAGLLVGVGVELTLFHRTAVLGVVVLAVLVALVLPTTLLAATRPGSASARKVAGPEVMIWAVVGALVAAGLVGGVALTQRLSAAYVVKHGTPVVVTLPSSCVQTLVKNTGSTSCDNATWQVNGVTATGTLSASYSELTALGKNGQYVLTDDPVHAFADGTRAVTLEYAGHSWFLALAALPWWVVLALPLALLVLPFAIRSSRRARAAAGYPPRPKAIQFKV